MQTLGLSESTPRTSGRLKSLFWPEIRNEADVDYVSRQGFWICFIIAAFTAVIVTLQALSAAPGLTANARRVMLAAGLLEGLFYYSCGVGIRQRSRFAAAAAFISYVLSSVVLGGKGLSVGRIVGTALLLSNVRATWLSARWRPDAAEPPPLPLDVTLLERFSGSFAARIWPVVRPLLYVLAGLELLLMIGAIFGGTTTSE